ncbi:l-threonine 3-dehydrogenase [Anaeramoeba flamelloides]|uniref:L-threonine 3-dehydrogenase, mitochondrial n=1 Tax=Anaeramoeba flamelloides TaxID=1746091 RepID=A0AAV7Z2N5_9EUKA|nr:l-threonine 3-dehydrogenase [Anaeramoeba flamelloides]KAJ6245112.1 l-threonine 3-dehydrogenase [Anaeramoeba flamelloides]KAJ6245122.1 l-threonine 3-dehydrogenase [Anaeramoeba flamelloides]|eukprot:Anaeramoba_flamelloidesa567963_628.p2 GENE.a567963_628~~a567963_628.p2  ORF type:complete len:324 (-),score=54.94 a567963_628:1275-2246(-)
MHSLCKSPRVLVTGSLGQIGTELVSTLRMKYGAENVLASDIKFPTEKAKFDVEGPFKYVNTNNIEQIKEAVVNFRANKVIHLSSILSATGEQNPDLAMEVNSHGAENCFKVCNYYGASLLIPSSIAAFGPETPRHNTPDLCIQRPLTMYGISKVYIELLGNWYNQKKGLDFRSLRLPGIISWKALPGGGTTDYAIDIYYQALKKGHYTNCFLKKDTRMPMMYMDDCIRGIIELLEAKNENLKQRTYNLGAIDFTPEEIYESIKKVMPKFKIDYKPDFRQSIADTWPTSIDSSCAKKDWGWEHDYDLDKMTDVMLMNLKKKLFV